MTQTLFTTQTPAILNRNDSTYTLGTAFKAKVPGNVLGIRTYVANVPTTSPSGAIFSSAGATLKSQAFGTLSPNQWNQILFSTPLHIDAYTLYVAAAGPLNVYNATSGFFTPDSYENGDLMAKLTGYNGNGRFVANAALTYPNQSFNDTLYFVDLIFQTDTEAADQHLNNRGFFTAAAW